MSGLDKSWANLKLAIAPESSEYARRLWNRIKRVMRAAVAAGRMPKLRKAIPKNLRKNILET